MAFPRIDIPDDPNWLPRGFTWEDMRHPKKCFVTWFHSKWDGARWDVLAFLKLRQRARTSDELLSYVTIAKDMSEDTVNTGAVLALLDVHMTVLKQLQEWRKGELGKWDFRELKIRRQRDMTPVSEE